MQTLTVSTLPLAACLGLLALAVAGCGADVDTSNEPTHVLDTRAPDTRTVETKDYDWGPADPEPGHGSSGCARIPKHCCEWNDADKCVKSVAGCQVCP